MTNGPLHYTVSTGTQQIRHRMQNEIWLSHQEGRSSCSNGGMFNLANSGFWYNDTDHRLGAAHEAGHLMGLIDRYNRETGERHSGWEGNIMSNVVDGRVEERNIREMLRVNILRR